MRFAIRGFRDSDRPALRQVYRASRLAAFPWLAPETLQLEDFDRDTLDERILVAEVDGRPCGFVSIWEPDSFLHHLFVHPDVFRRGIGRALLQQCLPYLAGRATLKCLKANGNALAFYRHLGWQVEGEGDSSDGPYYLVAAPDKRTSGP